MTHSDPPAGQDDAGGRDAEIRRLTQQVADLDQQLRQLSQQLITNKPEQPATEELVSWLTVTDLTEAATVIEQLREWLEQVYLRYPNAALGNCWAWHPDVVEELWWLRNAWYEAYSGAEPSWQKVGDWHERYRPGALARINAATRTCGLDVHARDPEGEPPVVPFADALPEIVTAWTSPHRVNWPPVPTKHQLIEARRLFDARHHHSRH